MINKFLAKLVNWSMQREDFSKSQFRADQEKQAKLAREKREQIMANRQHKYVSERTVPTEETILSPSDSEPGEK